MSVRLAVSTVQATPVTADWNTWAAKYGRYPDVATYYQSLQTEPLMYSASITDCVNLGMIPNVAWSSSTLDLSTVPAGALDSIIDSNAAAIQSSALTEVQCRLWHEMNNPGNSYGPQTSGHPSNPTDTVYLSAWRYIVSRTRAQTSKIKFVWTPTLWTAAGAAAGYNQNPSPRWPGTAYVDAIGWDGYSTTGYTVTFDQALGGTENNYGIIMNLPGAGSIPFYVTESGTGVQTQKATWYHDAILGSGGLLAKYPAITQFTAFDRVTDGEYTIDGSGSGGTLSLPARAAFTSLIHRAPFVDITESRRLVGL